MQTRLKKKISLICFQRILRTNPYIFCFSNVLLTNIFSKKKFISNYIFKTLYLNVFPVKFLSKSFKNLNTQNITNNFLNFINFSNSKNFLLYFNTLETSDNFKFLFIKYQNIYFIKDYNFFFRYLNIFLFLNKLKYLLLKHLFILNLFIKKKIFY